jgi:hypothetical protein
MKPNAAVDLIIVIMILLGVVFIFITTNHRDVKVYPKNTNCSTTYGERSGVNCRPFEGW